MTERDWDYLKMKPTRHKDMLVYYVPLVAEPFMKGWREFDLGKFAVSSIKVRED